MHQAMSTPTVTTTTGIQLQQDMVSMAVLMVLAILPQVTSAQQAGTYQLVVVPVQNLVHLM